MDYGVVDRVMRHKGFNSDPAFNNVAIAIEPTPDLNGCPLGVYDPNRGLIIIPADGTEAVLLHELGHRHGHFYYDNLSEKYAEGFRHKHQKGLALLYRGTDFGMLSRIDKLFQEGENGVVEIPLERPASMAELADFKRQVCSYCELPPGEVLPRFFYMDGDRPSIRIEFTKGVEWLPVIGGIMIASAAAGLMAMGYGVYKTSEQFPWILPMAVVSASSFFIFRAVKNDMKRRGVA